MTKKEGQEKETHMIKKKSSHHIEEAILQNFISLQKVLTNLTIKFEDMSENISKLLQLFEISAKNFVEKYPSGDGTVDQEFIRKLDSLLDQNKTIAKGIMLMEEKVRNKANPQGPTQFRPNPQEQGFRTQQRPRPIPRNEWD